MSIEGLLCLRELSKLINFSKAKEQTATERFGLAAARVKAGLKDTRWRRADAFEFLSIFLSKNLFFE